jgi:hypothetical protein
MSERVKIRMKYTGPAQSGEGETLVKQCAYYSVTSKRFETDGCELVSVENSSEVECQCTHLTDFALFVQLVKERHDLREHNACLESQKLDPTIVCVKQVALSESRVERFVQLFIAVSNYGLAIIVLIKVLRFSVPELKGEMDKGRSLRASLTIIEYQCFLIFMTVTIIASIALCKYLQVINPSTLKLSAFLLSLPMLAAFWSASLTIANWAKVIHSSSRKGGKTASPLAGMEKYYFGFNCLIIVALGVCWYAMLANDWNEGHNWTKLNTWVKIGSTVIAIPELMLCFSALGYGSALIRKIRESLKAFAKKEDEQHKMLVVCYKTSAMMLVFAVAFLIQAILEIIAAYFPEVYTRKIGNDAYAMSPMNAVHSVCSLCTCTMIVFCTVRLEEMKIVVGDIGRAAVKLFERAGSILKGQDYGKLEEEKKSQRAMQRKQTALQAALA